VAIGCKKLLTGHYYYYETLVASHSCTCKAAIDF